jgi:chromosome partitioning protein
MAQSDPVAQSASPDPPAQSNPPAQAVSPDPPAQASHATASEPSPQPGLSGPVGADDADQADQTAAASLGPRTVDPALDTPTGGASPDPTANRSPDPTGGASPDPTGGASPDPTANRSPDPTGGASSDPTANASPDRTGGASPDPTANRSPDPSAVGTPTAAATLLSPTTPPALETPDPSRASGFGLPAGFVPFDDPPPPVPAETDLATNGLSVGASIPPPDVPGSDPSAPIREPLRRHPGAAAHPLPRRFAIANQKGGVGKTTTAVNLGAALAEIDYRVLVVDLDPQGNATTGLGINGRNLDASIYDVILHDVPIEDVIEPTTLRNLFVVPATIDLAGAEIELVPVFSRELRLRRALETIEADFDFILIDCPPSLGLLTVNGLAAAGEVVVPIQCEYYALEGLGQLLRNVGLVQSNLNRDLEVSTIILTMYDARTRLAEQVVAEVRQHFGDRVCRNVVPRTVRLSEAPSFGQPIIVFDSSSRGAIAYRELAKEVSGGAPQRVR